jgi:hypothetical protein
VGLGSVEWVSSLVGAVRWAAEDGPLALTRSASELAVVVVGCLPVEGGLGRSASWSEGSRLGREVEVLQNAPYHEAVGQQRDELARSAASGACERVDGEDTLEQLGPGQARDGWMGRGAGRGGSAESFAVDTVSYVVRRIAPARIPLGVRHLLSAGPGWAFWEGQDPFPRPLPRCTLIQQRPPQPRCPKNPGRPVYAIRRMGQPREAS